MRRICLALLLLMLFIVPVSALDFVTETVDEGSIQGEFSSLVFDNEGNPHISFVGNDQYSLKYASYDGTDWVVQIVETTGNDSQFGNATSIALDQNGYPHISYYAGCDYNDLRHAWFDGLNWNTETVDSEGNVGKHSSIAIDSEGNPHIGYHTYDSKNLKYAKKIENQWVIETIVSEEINCTHSSMVLDSNDNPHFSYKYGCSDSSNLYYVYYDGNDWSVPQEVDSSDYTGKNSSITLDSNGVPHISYLDSDNDDLKYAFLSGDQWVTSTVDSDGYIYDTTSIKIDSDGYVHISYFESNNDELLYALYDGNEWTFTIVDSDGYVGQNSSLALDPSGTPSISYSDNSNQDLKFASFEGQDWDIQIIPIAGKPRGYYPDMLFDSGENIHLVYTAAGYYRDESENPVFYAYHNGTKWQKTVIAMGDSNNGASLAMDNNDVPHVLVGDSNYSPEIGSHFELKYGMLSEDSWDFSTVALGDSFASLAVEGNGTPHISFINRTDPEPFNLGASASYSETLCYAVKSGEIWDIVSMDQEGDFGMNTIALDNDNSPHICYFKEQPLTENLYDLNYAAISGDEWVINTVSLDFYGYEGFFACDMALEDDGTPHIAFVKLQEDIHDASITPSQSLTRNSHLNYATLNNGDWNIVSVDTIYNVRGGKISIQLDNYDNPHITYGSNEMMDIRKASETGASGEPELRYAYYDGSTWHTETLATGNMSGFGLQSTLALTSNNIPHIAYFTGTGVNYMTVPQEEAELISSGDGCNLAIFSPAMVLLILPLLSLFRNRK